MSQKYKEVGDQITFIALTRITLFQHILLELLSHFYLQFAFLLNSCFTFIPYSLHSIFFMRTLEFQHKLAHFD